MTKAELIELNDSLEDEKTTLTEQATQFSIEKLAAEAELEGFKKSFDEKEEELEALKKEIEELKAKLAEHEEEMAEKDAAISEHDDEMAKKDEELAGHKDEEEKMKAKAEELSSKVVKLEKLIEGTELVAGSKSDDVYEPSKANRSKIITEFAKEHGISEFSATLRLGKERPELFKL
jgi:chromosome segregation ATPase